MHHCPDCGQGCHCSGDIDDAEVMTVQWVYRNCLRNHGAQYGCGADDDEREEADDMAYEEWLEREQNTDPTPPIS